MKKTIYRTEKSIYFIIKGMRTIYYKARVTKSNRVYNKFRISKDKFYKEINRIKRINNKK